MGASLGARWLHRRLGSWAGYAVPGLVVLEVHSVPPAVSGQFLEQSESFHFDAIPALNKKLVLDLARVDSAAKRNGVMEA